MLSQVQPNNTLDIRFRFKKGSKTFLDRDRTVLSVLKSEILASNCLRSQRNNLRKYQQVSGQLNYVSNFCFVNSSVGIALPPTGSPAPSTSIDEMRDITNQLIPTGVYSIKNVAFGQLLSLQPGQDSLQGSSASTDLSDRWIVVLLSSNKFLLRNGRTGLYAHPESDYGEGELIYVHHDPYEWVIKAVKGATGIYQIYSRTDFKLCLSCTESGTSPNVEFSRDIKSDVICWTFTKEADILVCGALPSIDEGLSRPSGKTHDNSLELTVPKGWTAVVSGVPLGKAINSIHLQSVTTRKVVDMVQLFNKRNDGKLTLRHSVQAAYHIYAETGPIGLGLSFFCTVKEKKQDPFVLSYTHNHLSKLSITTIDRADDVRRFPDFRVYHIVSLNKTDNLACAVVTIHLSKEMCKSTRPKRPPQGTVNPGYNPENDEDRPQRIDDYLRKHNSLFLIDDSGSMAGPQWAEARKALIDIANEAMRCDSEGISLRFLNSRITVDGIKGQDALLNYFDRVKADGGTPTGARLDAILGQYINGLDNAIGMPEYSTIKPLDLICLTDGAPGDVPLLVLEKWAAHLDAKKHHPNAVGVQFVQIGNAPGCTAALVALTKGKVRNMVDTVPYNGLVTPDRLTRILLGAIKPSVRGNAITGSHLP